MGIRRGISGSFRSRIALGFLAFLAIAVAPLPAWAELVITGKDADVQKLKDMIKACRKKSKSFDKLVSDIEKGKTKRSSVSISVGRTGAYVDDATGGMGHTDVNLSNLEQFPDPEVGTDGHLVMPEGVPPWATTRCENIAHWLREAQSTASTESKDIKMGHSKGIDCQNDIRHDFKQEPICTGSYNHYKDEDHHTGFQYTQISYGTSGRNEKLRFDADGHMTITYYSSNNTEYKPAPAKTAGAGTGTGGAAPQKTDSASGSNTETAKPTGTGSGTAPGSNPPTSPPPPPAPSGGAAAPSAPVLPGSGSGFGFGFGFGIGGGDRGQDRPGGQSEPQTQPKTR